MDALKLRTTASGQQAKTSLLASSKLGRTKSNRSFASTVKRSMCWLMCSER
jgi:hypothetical protein